MPAVSKQQRKFMGLVHAVQKGEVPASKVSKSARDAAKQMKKKDVEDFASTDEKGLPTRKTESGILYRAGVKKYGKEGMRKIQQAAGKRKSHAVIGAIKDKYEKESVELDEGEMGILKNHISIISFLKPGLVKVFETDSKEENYYVEDGIIEFKNNCLSILTSNILDIEKIDKKEVSNILAKAEKDVQNSDISDQAKYLIDHKIEVLKSLTLN